ncbi:hypothetical protein U4E84_17730, partial [Halorubrum sp. AD140]|nr:hypothetical protein [Halorubrum sp. AD140]
NGDEITLVRVKNRFNHDVSIVDLEVGEGEDVLDEISYDPDDRDDQDNPEIETGEDIAIKAPVTGITPGEDAHIEISITVEGSGVTAQLFGDTETRRFTIKRDDVEAITGDSSGVYFNGAGNAEILGGDETETVDVYLKSSGNSGDDEVTTREDEEIDTGQKISGQLDGDSSDTIVGVKLDDTVYVHPQWNPEDCDLDQPNPGGLGDEGDDRPSCESD